MATHHFYLEADWPGGRNSSGYIDAGNLKTEVSIPEEMDGPGISTNPDEMLLGAAGTCYIITLAAMIERAKLPLKEMSLQSEGVVDYHLGIITYKKIIHRPYVSLQHIATENDYETLHDLIEKAEASCMISRALKGNVTIELQPRLNED